MATPETGRLITLRDIARATGLSLAAVSMALSDSGSLAAATRTRVKATAARLGYVRNPLLGALALRRRPRRDAAAKVPILLVGGRTARYSSPSLKPAAVARAAELGYALRAEFVDLATVNWTSWARVQFSRGVHGLLLSPLLADQGLPSLPWERFAVVGAGRPLVDLGFPCVSGDFFAAVLTCHSRLRAAGCRRIGFVPLCHDPEHPDDRARYAACLLARETDPGAADVPILRTSIMDGTAVVEETKRWFVRYRPDGVVAFHPGILATLREAGADVPARVRFASLNIEEDVASHRGVAGIEDAILRTQVAAVELLDSRIRHSRFGLEVSPPRVVVDPVWLPGETCPE